MDIIIIDRIREFKLAILMPEERREFIFFGGVDMAPIVIWFYEMQGSLDMR